MLTIALVQQGAWDIPLDSMPLASGYLKATLDADQDIAAEIDVRICNFRGGTGLTNMARDLFSEAVPDIIGFSVLGWNYRSFACLAETFKQLNPAGLVVFGGNHVAHQAARVFREHPQVDVVVNGEGEHTMLDLVRYLLTENGDFDPHEVAGISYKRPDGTEHTTAARERIENLDIIPSPFLTGTLPMLDAAGNFRYDVALMETNRGCPYKCSFCYWGGAVGQRMRSFSRERLAEELDFFAFHESPTIVLCDSNFGLLEQDEEFVEDLIEVRNRRGYPRALETSWAKNKSARFMRIVSRLRENGFKSSFTLALQTLSDEALTDMQRKNMKVNKWEGLVDWLNDEGLDCYAELIWGAPGETPESFLDGYDRLASRVPRIAVYPLLLLPNTNYVERRDLHGFVTVRGQDDDFEYVLANRGATIAENLEMQRFIFWARIFGENQYLRHLWRPARDLTGLSQSELVQSLITAADRSADAEVAEFRELAPVIAESPAVIAGLRRLYAQPRLERFVAHWWEESVVPRFPAAWRRFALDLYDFERWSRPVYVEPAGGPPPGWRETTVADTAGYASDPVEFSYDVAEILGQWEKAQLTAPSTAATTYVFEAQSGFYEHMDNHETAAHYMGTPRRIA
ncbi:KedN5 family methylcobalamin-dependent radical SAM C-methyltransferase [Actinomadura harenae]|uniref:Radical SAM protein n=1 Tax=Actinomadura harenae TaxID=2483351 RepID=A0A3M2M0Q3_9ACTN|nr:KedN5 family methylcobalamin-dependent radical SAM C-methyltransferase [Actinomadura harenae]RMI43157.1 radical SAM protein [Actinomadura harenae]